MTGSSPRAWGTRSCRTPLLPRETVHPHVRGEHSNLLLINVSVMRFIPTCVGNTAGALLSMEDNPGSSPTCVGNTLFDDDGEFVGSRFIPTCVGNTCEQAAFPDPLPRFIPTCVGNTEISDDPGFVVVTVHPHVRGEHLSPGPGLAVRLGSSPRAWGTPDRVSFQERQGRFIPTCVGNTEISTTLDLWVVTVHPHVRGEHVPLVK